MKKALVTGADGFIGSHLVELLVKEGFQVRALSYYNSFNYWGWLEDVSCLKQIEVVTGDIRDSYFCKKICKDIDTVFHLAALIAIPYSYQAPDAYIQTNVTGTSNMCLAALENNVKRFVHTSTSEVYGTAQYVPIDEKHPLQPQSPYSASKIGADSMALSYHNSFQLPLTVARPFNTYGPRQSARAIIPTLISQMASGQDVIKVGDLIPTRDFNFVEDTARGLLLLGQSEKTMGRTVNIGSNTEISIGDLLTLLQKLMNKKVTIVSENERKRPANSEVFRLWADNKLIKELTGYQPNVSLEEGLKATIQWFQNPENLKKYKTEIYNV